MTPATRRPQARRRGPHRLPEPRARDRRVLRAAVGRRPEPEKRRAEAFVAYVLALPAEVDSVNAIRGRFAEDLHALFEVLLAEHRRGIAREGSPRP